MKLSFFLCSLLLCASSLGAMDALPEVIWDELGISMVLFTQENEQASQPEQSDHTLRLGFLKDYVSLPVSPKWKALPSRINLLLQGNFL